MPPKRAGHDAAEEGLHLRLRHYAPRTISVYVAAVARFARHFRRSPEHLDGEHVRLYQLHLLARRASWSRFNQAVGALRFLYRVTLRRPDVVQLVPYGKKPKPLPGREQPAPKGGPEPARAGVGRSVGGAKPGQRGCAGKEAVRSVGLALRVPGDKGGKRVKQSVARWSAWGVEWAGREGRRRQRKPKGPDRGQALPSNSVLSAVRQSTGFTARGASTADRTLFVRRCRMSETQGPSLANAHLHRRLVVSVQNFLAKLQQTRERLYGFALLLPSQGDYTQAAAVTEEALTRSIEAFARLSKLQLHSETECAALRTAMRWSGPGDGWYLQCDTDVTDIRRWFAAARKDGELTGAEGEVDQLCSAVLQELDGQGAFGQGEARARVVLGLWDRTQSDTVFLKWAGILNPAAVVTTLRQELDQMRAAQSR
jgi:hypothetical protein